MHTLFVDLASNQGCIACVDRDNVLAFTALDHRVDDASLMDVLQETLKTAGWAWGDIQRLACVTGPGGFTSLRVAVACINALAYALKIPSCGIPLWEIYEARLPPPLTPSPMGEGEPRQSSSEDSPSPLGGRSRRMGVWVHSTKRTHVFLRTAGQDAEPACIAIADLAAHVRPGDIYMGELLPEHQAIVESLGLKSAPLQPLENILPSLLAAQPYEARTLVPWYGRGW